MGMERKLTAILYADVAGYSRLTGDDEEGTHATLKAHLDVLTQAINAHQGRVVNTAGDAVLAEFASVVTALKCAVAAQRDLAECNKGLADDRKLQFRIGVNLGDVMIDDEIYGNGVNVAARLETLAEAGGICISERVLEQVEGKLDVGFAFLGPQSVKNIKKPVRAYRILLDPKHAGTLFEEVTPQSTQWKRIAAVGLTVFVAATAALAIWERPTTIPLKTAAGEKAVQPVDGRPSIVVLPFDNLSGDPEQEYIGDGFTEDLITILSQDPHLLVIARHSSFAYKGKMVTPQQVAQDLGIQYVLEGSIRKAGDTVRVTAQLINALDGTHIWAKQYDRNADNVLELQDEIIQRIVSAIGNYSGEIFRSKIEYFSHKKPQELDAFDQYWYAKQYFYKYTRDGIRRAKELWRDASKNYPNFTPLYPAIGWMYYYEYGFGWSDDPKKSVEMAFDFAHKTLDMENASPLAIFYARWLLAKIYGARDKRFDLSLAEYDKAESLMPNNADLLASKAEVLVFARKPQDAIKLLMEAIRRNPRHPPWYLKYLGEAYFAVGRYGDAIDVLVPIDKNWSDVHLVLAASYMRLNRVDDARREIEALHQAHPKISLKSLPGQPLFQKIPDPESMLADLRKAGLREG
jgi:adenylate cyclase